ncbi:MAG: nicotinate phosphoribosyltransferase [Clostridiales bacterium]|jgi:nicotinate phosphoribosyltransferase|nr:nicotinate phosphoribosyltransferase [Clostridiales bacterium]
MEGQRNLALLTDLYQLTMMNGYLQCGVRDKTAVFDMFYRGTGGFQYAIAAGLEQVVSYIRNLRFDDGDLRYLRGLNIFSEDFLDALKDFKFTGDIYAVPEGTVVFPYEPIIIVKAPLFQAQFVETALLNIVNHQTLIATKAARLTEITSAAISEFGLRRAQGPDAGIYGARAAYIGGCRSTSNVLAGKMFGIPVKGTHAHSWVMSFPDELTAFRAYAEIYPSNCLLLVDTYDTLKSGVPNAIKVFDELKAKGFKPVGIRLDSGDLAYLSKQARKMLDAAGHNDVLIFASSDIDEDILTSLALQEAKIDVYGIGTRLITSFTNASLGGVYKLAAIDDGGALVPKMKISNTNAKNTNPGFKKIIRIYDANGQAAGDLISLADDVIDESRPLTIFHPEEIWKKTVFTEYTVKNLVVKVFENGKLIYDLPSLNEIAAHADASRAEFYPEYKRSVNPQEYKVDLSQSLYDLKQALLKTK